MSRALPPGVAQVGHALAATAGGYLRNTVREEGVTCTVCSAPVANGYMRCYPCKVHADSMAPLADRAASIVYAVEPAASGRLDQTYTAMYGYKSNRPQAAHTNVISSLLVLGIVGHLTCDLSLSGASNVRWATVPSTQRSDREHPLHRLIAIRFREASLEIAVTAAPGAVKERTLQPNNFRVGTTIPPSTHVAVFDDSWVTGGSAQSLAISLRAAGAATVSILTVARVLRPDYGPNAEFIRTRLGSADFDFTVCPWTGGPCP